MYEATGKIKVIFETQTFPSGFTKREFVLTTGDGNYPQDLKFELIKDKCTFIDPYQEGQEVTVSFDIRGNEYKGKYYVNLSCWKIQGGAQGGTSPNAAPQTQSQAAPTQASNANQTEPSPDELVNDDIPF